MGYINPHESDADTIASDGRLSRRQAREDFLAARAEGGMDAAIAASKRGNRPALENGFQKIPGASRSGALYPHVKARFLGRERAGEIELQRDGHGHLIGWRPLDGDDG